MPGRYRNAVYLKWITSLPCSHCRAWMGVEAHHAIGVGLSGMGLKASDLAVMPLCQTCHAEVHDHPHDFPQLAWIISSLERAFGEGVFR